MPGILAYGAYIPRYVLTPGIVAAATGKGGRGPSQRSVANHDEDAITLAVEAAATAVGIRSEQATRALLFASCSSPYVEKQASTLIATVCGLPQEVLAVDVAASPRAGTAALRLGAELARSLGNALVVASEARPTEQGSDLELQFGDAAAAVLLGEGETLATLEGAYSLSEEFTDVWRRTKDAHVHKGEDGFVTSYGYSRILLRALQEALAAWQIAPGARVRFAFAGPAARPVKALQSKLGFASECFPADLLLDTVGDTGSAHPLLLLINALEAAQPGDYIVSAAYGAGNADVLLWKATEHVTRVSGRRTVAGLLARQRPIKSYYQYMQFRGHLPGEAVDPFASLTMDYREQGQNLRLQGSRCTECGQMAYPARRVCTNCGAVDQVEPFRLSHHGVLFTFEKDYLYPSPDWPTVMAVADLAGGGRFFGQMTDTDADGVEIGMPVRLAFRRLHEGGGYVNYYWKLCPEEGRADA